VVKDLVQPQTARLSPKLGRSPLYSNQRHPLGLHLSISKLHATANAERYGVCLTSWLMLLCRAC